MKRGTVAFLRWWFMDRLMDFWENWVGYFITDTVLVSIFYWLMGASVAWDVSPPLLREFDLQAIGIGSDVSGAVFARTIEPQWLRLRRVEVGSNCDLKTGSIVMPGCTLGDGTVMEPNSVALEGAVTGASTTWKWARITIYATSFVKM